MIYFTDQYIAILFALNASNAENLIEGINIIGSLFYGTVLGIFVVGFFLRKVDGQSVFIGALLGQSVVFGCHALTLTSYISLGYLWYNAIGCGVTILSSMLLALFRYNPLNE